MKKTLTVIGLLVAMLYACHQNTSSVLTPNNLSSEFFTIDITKDTVLTTKKGAVIKIPKGALAADDATITLEVKEAYSMQDIVLAGMNTQSNGQLLSSGGMFYLNAAGDKKLKILKPISVSVPSRSIESNMKLFKGEVKKDGSINWTETTPIKPNRRLALGQALFVQSCASCHALGQDLTGPDLAHVMKRLMPYVRKGRIEHPYAFTKNPARVMYYDPYYRSLKEQSFGVVMTAFPDLSRNDMNALYGWIENESDRLNLPDPGSELLKCVDSCKRSDEKVATWWQARARAVDSVRTYRRAPANLPKINDRQQQNRPVDDEGLQPEPLFYDLEIYRIGWYNIEKLLNDFPDMITSELIVRVPPEYLDQVKIDLIIPSYRAMLYSRPLDKTPNAYGFYANDGTAPLPQQAKAIILAVGGSGEDIFYAKEEFVIGKKQSFDLQFTSITKQALEAEIKALTLDEVRETALPTRRGNCNCKSITPPFTGRN